MPVSCFLLPGDHSVKMLRRTSKGPVAEPEEP